MISNEIIIQGMNESIISSLGSRLKKVLLYWSVARGDSTAESDIDCILIVDDIDTQITDAIDEFSAKMLINYGAVFSIIPVKEDNFDNFKYNPLFINVNRDGIVLWQKSAWKNRLHLWCKRLSVLLKRPKLSSMRRTGQTSITKFIDNTRG